MPVAHAAVGVAPVVSVDGSRVSDAIARLLQGMVLEDSQQLPDVVELRYADMNAGLTESGPFKIGAKLVVELKAPGQQPSKFTGEITGLTSRYTGGRLFLVVRGLDVLHRLGRGRITKTFESMTTSDVVKKVLGDAGVPTGTPDATTVTFPFLSVVNETPLGFLRRIAADADRVLHSEDGKVHLRKRTEPKEPVTLSVGGSLLSLEATVTGTGGLTKEVEVRGWDFKEKKAVVGKGPVTAPSSKGESTPGPLSTKFGTSKSTIVASPGFVTQAQVDATAKSVSTTVGSGYLEIVGLCSGHTAVRAGTTISLDGVAKPFKGTHVVSSTRHLWDEAEGYLTEFTVSADHDRSLLGLASSGAGSQRRSMGVAPGVVTDTKDPDGMGRVRIALPWAGDEHVSDWARVAHPLAGPDAGLVFTPSVNDEVLVAFEHDDPGRPYVVGSLHNGKDKMPDLKGKLDVSGKVVRHGIYTKDLEVSFVGESGKESMVLGFRSGAYAITIDKKGTTVRVVSDGKVEIEAKSDISLKTTSKISLDAKGAVSIKGLSVDIEAKASAALKATGPTVIKGATVAIN